MTIDARPEHEPGPADATRSEGVARIMTAGLAATVERFDDPALLSEGKINLIALDAIVERLGRRWLLRRDQVYAHVERTLQRHLGVQGYYARISESDFLICQPELGRFSGQAACLRYLREILIHFLGEATLADNCVHQVTKITAKQIEAERVNPRLAERQEEAEQAELAKRVARAPRTPNLRAVGQWSPFVASDGRELRVTCTLDPSLTWRQRRR